MSENVHCQFTRLPSGIRNYVFLDGTRRAVDEYIALIEPMYQQSQGQGLDMGMSLVDLRQAENLPVVYAYTRLRQLLSTYGELKGRVAYLHNERFLYKVAEVFAQLLKLTRSEVRFFSDYEKAVQWLLSEKAVQG